MRELLLKGGLFCLGGILILHALAYVARNVDPDGTSLFLRIDREHVQYTLDNAEQIEVIVVGSSHGDDVLISELKQSGSQLSRAWGDLFEAEYYLKTLVPKLPNLKVVYIPLSYFTFGWDNASASRLGSRRVHLYSIVPSWRFLKGDLNNFVVGKSELIIPVNSILREDHWKGIFYAVLGRAGNSPEFTQADGGCEYLDQETLAEYSRERVQEQINLGAEIAGKRPDVQRDSFTTAVEIIHYLDERGVRLVFFTPPYFESYTTAYQRSKPEAIQLLKDNMQKLSEEYGVEYYDYSMGPDIIHDHSLFKDGDHLNECGARVFTQKLIDTVETNQGLP